MPIPPMNMKLTRMLGELRGRTGTARRQVVELLKRSRLLLEVLSESDLNVLATQDEEGMIVLPVFTCADEARASLPRTASMTIAVVPAAEILRRALLNGVSYILVNPASCRWRLSRQEIEALVRGCVPAAASNTLESRIEKELESYKRRTGDLVESHFLNNFYGHLPGGFYRRLDLIGLNRPYTNPGAGKKRKEMSLAQFHELIDRLIAELGLDLTKIARLHEGKDDDDAYRNILPLYVQMRKEGFKHYPDLTA